MRVSKIKKKGVMYRGNRKNFCTTRRDLDVLKPRDIYYTISDIKMRPITVPHNSTYALFC